MGAEWWTKEIEITAWDLILITFILLRLLLIKVLPLPSIKETFPSTILFFAGVLVGAMIILGEDTVVGSWGFLLGSYAIVHFFTRLFADFGAIIKRRFKVFFERRNKFPSW